ncbi:hypothetical protein COO91_01057 [Nostoc flagelliforme CCNUN1]|uniref:Uncharacterized protein n=1 Tax=Nostoc flagelliforme CCNUN1 TaxID=2038116 RepID=A0A2K8SIB7_9NOSO|nr:hypothetical protein COO91_01057 [Nostoc flagelliforme CCNUN1]
MYKIDPPKFSDKLDDFEKSLPPNLSGGWGDQKAVEQL